MFSKTKIILCSLAVLLLPVSVLAAETYPQQVVVGASQTIDGNFLAAARDVVIHGTVNGDVIVAGANVIVDGTVSGDVIAAGGQVEVSGPVGGNVRLVGSRVIVDGVVARNASVAGGDVTFGQHSAIGWGLLVAAANGSIAGSVKQDIRAAVANLQLDARVGKDVLARTSTFLIKSQTRINGDLSYSGKQAADVLSGAAIKGTVDFQPLQTAERMNRERSQTRGFIGFVLLCRLIVLIGLWLLGLILLRSFPKTMQQMSASVRESFWSNLGKGVVLFVLAPIVAVILLLTILGVPFAVLTMLVWAVTLWLAPIVFGLAVGEPLLKKILHRHWRSVSPTWSLLVGLLLLYLIALIPFIGMIAAALLVMASMGSLLSGGKEILKRTK